MPQDEVATETAVVDEPATKADETASVETPPEKESASPVSEAAAKVNIVDALTGQVIPVTPQERDWLAQQGLQRLAEQRAAKEEGSKSAAESKTDTTSAKAVETGNPAESDEDDPALKKVVALESRLDQTTRTLDEIQQRDQLRQENEKLRQGQASQQRMLEELERQHGLEHASEVDRAMVKHRANDLANEAANASRVVTYAACHEAATKEIGERLAEGVRAQWAGKQKVREAATEGPAGISAAEITPPKFAKTKEENRKLAQEMRDGTVTDRAQARYEQIMSGSGV